MVEGALEITTTIPARLSLFFNTIDPKAREKGMFALGLQLLNYTVNGSPKESSRPPILTGRLRGSGSVFVGKKKVGDSLFAGKGKGTPSDSSGERDPDTVTIGFNTKYATRMHEQLIPEGELVPHKDAETVTGKFLQRHLDADKKALFFIYAEIYRKWAGT